jgi:hypothetical protein
MKNSKMPSFIKDNQKMIIKGVIVLVVVYLIYKNWWRMARVLKPKSENTSPDTENGVGISDSRKTYIEGVSSDLYNDIYYTGFTGHDYTPYSLANGLFDDEVKYLADFYKNHLSAGNSLYNDINSQWYTWGNEAENLMNLLASNGKKN